MMQHCVRMERAVFMMCFCETRTSPDFEELMQSILPENEKPISGRNLLRVIGGQIEDRSSILRSAYDMNVPVFCPAMPDSMIGLQGWLFSQTRRLIVDAFADIKEIVDICYESKAAGILIIGVVAPPRTSPFQSMLVTPRSFDSSDTALHGYP